MKNKPRTPADAAGSSSTAGAACSRCDWLAGIVDGIPGAVLAVDASSRVRLLNRPAEALFGRRSFEVEGEPVEVLIPGWRPAPARRLDDSFGTTRSVRLQGLHATGTPLALDCRQSVIHVAGEKLYVFILRDEEELSAENMALVHEWAVVEAIFHAVEALVVAVDEEGRIAQWNAACEAHAGVNLAAVQQLPFWEVVGCGRDRDRLRRLLGDLDENPPPESFECIWENGQGEPRLITWSNRRVTDDGGRFMYLICTGIDVTERVAYQRRLQETMRQKDQFLAMLGHELRNPLHAMQTALEVQRLTVQHDPRANRAAEILQRQVLHMARLIDDLLEVSRMIRGRIRLVEATVELGEVCRVVVDDFLDEARQRGVQLRLELPAEPVWVRGDRTRLVQILSNLVSNALKFTDSGWVLVQLEREDGTCALRVRDTGKGIEPEVLGHVFEPFRQGDESLDRHKSGLGLGLSLVQGLAQLHGGEVEGYSEGAGRGATFTVRLPLLAQRAAEAPVDQPGSA